MKKQKTKKVLAMLLAVSLLMPMLPILPGMSTTVYGAEPDVRQFATPAELVDSDTFSLDRSKPESAQAIYFGQNSSSVPQKQKWYIAGADTNDGLVLMCDPAKPLATNQKFNESYSEQSYDKDWGCTYASPDPPAMVNANHYGGSDLRAVLKGLETDSRYFSPSEQDLMQETTITTNDTENQTTYTTTDKLYAAYGEYNVQYITVGTNAAGHLNGGLKINLTDGSPYADSRNGGFWLRSPYRDIARGALRALPGYVVNNVPLGSDFAVVPAFHLNLSSVLFASAASAASSDGALTTSDAMTLRYMPAAGTSLGTAAINSAQNSVSVSDAPAETYLVVQNGSDAWAKKVSGNETITASEIDSSLTSFVDCKVWLETTNTDRITTAVMAVQGHETKITNPPDSHITRSTAEGNVAETQIVAPGTAITDVVYTADSGYYFPEGYTVESVNGISVTQNSPTQITVSGTPTANATINLVAATEKSGQTAPRGLSDGISKINGTQIAMEYAAAADAADWTTCTEGTTVVEAGIWYVRYKETDTKKASPVTEIIVSAPSYTITTDPAALNFDSVNLDENGSYIQPDVKTVTVKNTGNSEVTLTKPASTSYTIGDLSKATLNAEESATFTIQPKGDLSTGTYSETLKVTTDKGTEAEVTVNFTVKAKTEDAPKVIKGADSKWTKGSKDGLSFTSNAEFDKFKKVMIDGKDIDASHYAVQSGSTIVTLKAEYLETLKAGKHTISIVSENGAADADFTIVKGADKPAPDKQAPNKQTPSENGKSTKVPQTGDNSNLALWLILLALCGGTIAAISIRKKRS